MQVTVDCGRRLRTASAWQRFVGGAIDLVLFVPPAALFAWVQSVSLVAAGVVGVSLSAVALAYPIYFHGRYGQTVGKLVVGIRLVKSDGEPIRRGRAWARSAPDLLFAIGIGAGLLAAFRGSALVLRDVVVAYAVWTALDLGVMLTNRPRRAAHDFLAGTFVVSDQVAARPAPRTAGMGRRRGRDVWRRALRRADA